MTTTVSEQYGPIRQSGQLLKSLVDPQIPIDKVAEALDSASPEERRATVLTLSRAQQRALYQKAAGGPLTTLANLVPKATPPLTQVRHAGRNTLPLADRLQLFEKRFCQTHSSPSHLSGYNAYILGPVLGAGYFVAEETGPESPLRARGGVVVDYNKTPLPEVPAGWPPVTPTTRGLQRFVYHGTQDFLRTVSAHVTIGAAYRGDKSLDHYFVLVREVSR